MPGGKGTRQAIPGLNQTAPATVSIESRNKPLW